MIYLRTEAIGDQDAIALNDDVHLRRSISHKVNEVGTSLSYLVSEIETHEP